MVTLSSVDLFIWIPETILFWLMIQQFTIIRLFKNTAVKSAFEIFQHASLTNTGETIAIPTVLIITIDAATYDPDWNNPNLPDTKEYPLRE